MRFDQEMQWSDKFIQTTIKHREMGLKEFVKAGGSQELHRLLHNSKIGYISVTKVSTNIGYLDSGEAKEGVTAAFGEGMSLYIADVDEWYRTSTIQRINWKDSTFTTLNSKYSFSFEEVDYKVISNEVCNESTSNQ